MLIEGLRKVNVFKKATMNDKNLSKNIRANAFLHKLCRCKRKIVKIDRVSLSIVKVMFEKDDSLNQIDGLVIPMPGSFDGLYVAAGPRNIIFFRHYR